jgi:A/G-specific adenine glycosylase
MGGTARLSAQTAAVVSWFDASSRDLPWRRDPRPWPVLVSEVMLQQTPVRRVLPVYQEWMRRWPTPRALAAEAPGEAVRAWGALGYPRRALRLHAAAVRCTTYFGGEVPSEVADLRSLPGVGEYTANAVAAFAYCQRQPVLDTNVRRVQARWLDGSQAPLTASITATERERALDLLPMDGAHAATVSVAQMELGALVCTSRTPHCTACPLSQWCAWYAGGRPAGTGARRRPQAWHGTDRQCRGRVMAVLRGSSTEVDATALHRVWDDREQLGRALQSLIDDGLAVADGDSYRLP